MTVQGGLMVELGDDIVAATGGVALFVVAGCED